jgi:multidrug transporter EmrE-like cation transporter
MVEPAENNNRIHKGLGLLLLVFLSSGLVDTGLNLIGHYYGKTTDVYTTSTIMFGAAGILGLSLFLLVKKKETFGWREITSGILLGWLNYASLIAILKGLIYFKGSTAWFLAVNNIGIVALSTIVAALFFGERLHKSGYWGLFLALVAIITLNFHAFF